MTSAPVRQVVAASLEVWGATCPGGGARPFLVPQATELWTALSPAHPAKDGVAMNGHDRKQSLFGWLVADGWCWFVLREEYCWLVAGGWFVLREKYCWLVADKPSKQARRTRDVF
jgi:hypothetical protein